MTPPARRPDARVLVVDDDWMTRLLSRTALEGAGFAVDEAADAATALAMFAAWPPDIILLDAMLGADSGFDLCRVLRTRPDAAHLPILMLTGREDVEAIQAAFDAGATDFTTKATRWPVVIERVRYLLRGSRTIAALDATQRRLAEAQETARIGHFAWRAGSRTVECSRTVAGFLALRPASADGPTVECRPGALLGRLPRQDRRRLLAATQAALAAGGTFEIELSAHPYRVRARYEKNAASDGFLIGTVQDIAREKATEAALRRAAEAAEEAHAAKTAFLSIVSHELLTPLNAIIGFAGLINAESAGPLGNETYRDYVDCVLQGGRRLHRMIGDVLLITRLEAGGLSSERIPTEIVALIRAAAAPPEGSDTEERGIAVHLSLEPATLPLDADAVSMMTTHLVRNAVKFSHAGGTVTVTGTGTADGGYRIAVADRGIGIPADRLPTVAAPFVQADSRLGRRYEGTGLGLSVVRQLSRLVGADFVLDSIEGEGTTAVLTLPGDGQAPPARA